jgi:Na+-driven multidrug efflux pump
MIGLVVAVAVGLLFFTIPRLLLKMFGMEDGVAVDIAVELLAYMAVSGLFVTVALAYTGALQGTGDTRSPLYISIVSQVIVPLGICFAGQAISGLEAPTIWLAIVVGHMVRAVLSVIRFRQGKWRDITVDIGPVVAKV